MSQHQNFHVRGHHSQMSRYDEEQGFSDEEKQPEIIISEREVNYESSNIMQKKRMRLNRQQPRAKLKYIMNPGSNRIDLHHLISNRQYQSRSVMSKDGQQKKKETNNSNNNNKSVSFIQTLVKSKRTLIGENLTLSNFTVQDFRALKISQLAEGHKLSFESIKDSNTHGYLKNISHNIKDSFIISKYNSLLKQRLKESFIMPKKKLNTNIGNNSLLEFNNQIQSGNLQMVFQRADLQYDLYLRIDTNTHGHQNWFHFEVTNRSQVNESFIFNICNMKRQFRLIEKGQKVFIKECTKEAKWQSSGRNIKVQVNGNNKILNGKIYKLSFTLNLKANTKYVIAMLPAYTYSQMMTYIQKLEEKHKNLVQVELLSYSLMGLAIPLVTITNKQFSKQQKKVILVSCRIHPGETVASFVAEGLMSKLVDQSSKPIAQMLKSTVFKIIPILNPDGVVLGNFRTNFLGVDLNRSFHIDDQILYPQIWCLKKLGKQIKSQFGNNFFAFLDLHGHSSEKNIFAYGPNFQYNDSKFYVSKILPKVLEMKSKYFKYQSCTFRLEEHKVHTARGYFLNELDTITYTIESSYSLFDDLDGITKLFKVEDWLLFGMQLAEGLQTTFRIKQANSIKSNRELRNVLHANETQEAQLSKKIKNEIRKQLKDEKKNCRKKQKQSFSMSLLQFREDSDGESEQQDLTNQQRQETQKKVLQISLPNFSLPRVLKPSIIYPTVTPKLFQVNEQKDESIYKVLYTKRNKYSTIKMISANNMYTNYLRNLQQLQRCKPNPKNIKVQKKVQI